MPFLPGNNRTSTALCPGGGCPPQALLIGILHSPEDQQTPNRQTPLAHSTPTASRQVKRQCFSFTFHCLLSCRRFGRKSLLMLCQTGYFTPYNMGNCSAVATPYVLTKNSNQKANGRSPLVKNFPQKPKSPGAPDEFQHLMGGSLVRYPIVAHSDKVVR